MRPFNIFSCFYLRTALPMVSKLLKGLKKGLQILKKHIRTCKDNLTAKLSCRENVSSDEAWLDGTRWTKQGLWTF